MLIAINMYECDVCKKAFSLKGNLAQHIKNVHLKAYNVNICPFSDKILSSKENLTKHVQNFHKNKGTCQCHECGKFYKNPGNLNEHVAAVHFAVRYECYCCIISIAMNQQILYFLLKIVQNDNFSIFFQCFSKRTVFLATISTPAQSISSRSLPRVLSVIPLSKSERIRFPLSTTIQNREMITTIQETEV